MLAQATSATPAGINARAVQIDVDVPSEGTSRVPPEGDKQASMGMRILGLADASLRETRYRVQSAVKAAGFDLPPRVVTVRLDPPDFCASAGLFDLPIALALLAALGHLPDDALEGRLLIGELGLDGHVRPVRGALIVAELAAQEGIREVIVPAANAAEAGLIDRRQSAVGVRSLDEAVRHLCGDGPIAATVSYSTPETYRHQPDLNEVRGNDAGKRALEIAAAGGHNLLFIGPPGSGKTMLARCLPGILPPLADDDALAVTKIHSLADIEPPTGLVRQRPFRSPHPSVSTAGMIGGGSIPRPGEVTLAHGGVLFLDELPELRRDVLEMLCQPLEQGKATIVRSRGRFHFPARFALVAAMTSCPCGHFGDPRYECRCTPEWIERYHSRISSTFDRFDLIMETAPTTLEEQKRPPIEASVDVAERVLAARSIQRRRFGGVTPLNAAMDTHDLASYAIPQPEARKILGAASERLRLSVPAVDRVLRVARTIADLAGSSDLRSAHVAEALQYQRRPLRRVNRER